MLRNNTTAGLEEALVTKRRSTNRYKCTHEEEHVPIGTEKHRKAKDH